MAQKHFSMSAKQLCAVGDKACKAELKRRGRDSSGKKIGSKAKSVKRKSVKNKPYRKYLLTPWPKTLRTKDGVVLTRMDYRDSMIAYQQLDPYDYANSAPEYMISTISGGKYKLEWWEEDRSEEEEFWDEWEGDDYIPDLVERMVLKSATPAQVRKKITGTNRPRIIKYNPRRSRRNRSR
jgi:hypothetical protein